MPNDVISSITLPNGSTYDLKDSTARAAIAGISVPSPSDNDPSMDGTASPGSSSNTDYSRSDHVHPTDTSRAASSHKHGNITNGGDITASAPTIASGDKIIINDESASKITNGPSFGSDTSKYLRNDGTWATPTVSGGVQFMGTKTSVAAIKALTNVAKGEMWLVAGATGDEAKNNGEEWIAKDDIGSTADATKWELIGSIDTEDLGDFAYVDAGTATFTPSGSVSVSLSGTGPTNGYGTKSAGSLPTHASDTFDPGTLPSFVQGTFGQGTLPSFTQGTFSPGSLPTFTVQANSEILIITAGSLPSHASDTFSAGSLPTHAADTFDPGSLPSYTQGAFTQGSLPTLSSTPVPASASGSFSGTEQTIAVSPVTS